MMARERYALVEFERDGLLLDLVSGSLFHLNEPAVMIWGQFLGGAAEATIAAALSARYRLPSSTALEHVAVTLTARADGDPTLQTTHPYLYERTGDAYTLSRGGRPLLLIDRPGGSIRLSHPGAVDAQELPMALQSVAPKLMALRGHFVMHASAVMLGAGAVAFCGKSGAGKTTTARSLARAGAALICEDKLVIQLRDDRIVGYVRGEQLIMDWVRRAAAELASGRPVSCEPLDQATAGEPTTLRAVAFLDADRRHARPLSASRLGGSQAAFAIFNNTFHGSDREQDWRRHLTTAGRAAHLVDAYEVVAPRGLSALDSAALDIVRRGVFP